MIEQRSRAVTVLREVLDRDNSLSRCNALRALQKLDAVDAKTQNKLASMLMDPDPDVRVDTAVALGSLGREESIAALLKNIEGDPEGEVRIQAAAALGHIGKIDALEPLIRCIKSEGYPELDESGDDMEFGASWEVQRQALQALAKIGSPDATEAVRQILQDENYDYLWEDCYRVLMKLDPDGSNRFLLDQYQQGSVDTKRNVLRAFGQVSRYSQAEHEQLRRILAAALTAQDSRLRRDAVGAAAKLHDSGIARTLAVMLKDSDAEVRQEVLEHLAENESEELPEILHELIEDAVPPHLTRLVRLLGLRGNASSGDRIRGLLQHEDEAVCYATAEALANLVSAAATDEMLQLVSDSNAQDLIRLQAIRTLVVTFHIIEEQVEVPDAGEEDVGEVQLTQAEEVIAALEQAAHDSSESVGLRALSALIEIYPDRAEQILAVHLEGHQVPQENAAAIPIVDITEREDPSEADDSGEQADTITLEELLPSLPEGGGAENSTLGSIYHAVDLEEQEATQTVEDAVEEESVDESEVAAQSTASKAPVFAIRLLGGLSSVSEETMAALVKLGAEPELRQEIIRTIGRLGDTRGLSFLLDTLDSDDSDDRFLALDALGEMPQLADGATDILERLSRDEDPTVREKALQPFASIEGGRAAEVVARALTDEDVHVCKAASSVLNTGNCSETTDERLVQLMLIHGGELRSDSARALSRLGYYGAAERLTEIINDESREEYHWICIDALAELFAVQSTNEAVA
jgi:HEAT repeat protein